LSVLVTENPSFKHQTNWMRN